MKNECQKVSAAGRDDASFGSRARALLISAGTLALILAQTASVSAGSKADTRGLWVPNVDNDTIVEYSASQRASSGSPVPAATIDSTALGFPAALVFDSSGNMWVVNGEGGSIVEFSAAQILELGTTPDPVPAVTITSSELEAPLADFDRSGNLWVSDFFADEILEFSKKQLKTGGNLTPAITITSPDLDGARNIAFDQKGNLWISSFDGEQIEEFAKKKIAKGGALTPSVIISSDGSGSLDGPEGLAFDHNHNLWVANVDNSTVVEFSSSSLKASGSPTPAVTLSGSSIDVPVGVGFDSKKNLWVSDFGSDSIVEFLPAQITSSGTPTATVTISSTADSLDGPEQFSFGD